jgi:hypothetical protein
LSSCLEANRHLWRFVSSLVFLEPIWLLILATSSWGTSSLGHACNALSKSSSTHAQYVGLNQYFSHPSLVTYFSQPHP